MLKSFLQLWLYRSSFSCFQLVFHENFPHVDLFLMCFGEGGEFHILLLCHLYLIPLPPPLCQMIFLISWSVKVTRCVEYLIFCPRVGMWPWNKYIFFTWTEMPSLMFNFFFFFSFTKVTHDLLNNKARHEEKREALFSPPPVFVFITLSTVVNRHSKI